MTLSYFTFSAAPDHLEDLDAIVAAFEAENPNITIEVQTAAYADYFTEPADRRSPAARAPDTFELNYENFVTYARSGALLDLSPYVASDVIDPARYYPLALEGFTDGGMQYGLPATFSDVVLIYNKDLFDAAGLDYPTADWTWEDEQAAAEELTDADAGVCGDFQPVSASSSSTRRWRRPAASSSTPTARPTFNSPEGVEAAEWLTSQAGHRDADGRRHRRHARLRHRAVQERQAGDVAHRHLAVHRPQRVGRRLRHRRRAGQRQEGATRCS